MKQDDLAQALRDGLIQGVKDHVAKIADNIIGDPTAGAAEEARRFANGLRATRTFYGLALAEIQKSFGEN